MSRRSGRHIRSGDIRQRLYGLQELAAYDALVREAQAALASDPDNGYIHVHLANALRMTDRPDEALEAATRATALLPDDEWPLRVRALALDQLERYDEALKFARRALRLAPDNSRTLNVMARCLLRCYQWRELREIAERMIAYNPEWDGAHYYTAVALKRLGDMPGSRHHIDTGLRIDPTNASFRLMLAIHYLQQGESKKAVRLCAEAITLAPKSHHQHTRLLFCLRQYLVAPPGREGTWVPCPPPANPGPLPALLHVLEESGTKYRARYVEWHTGPLDGAPPLPLSDANRAVVDAVYQQWREPASEQIGQMTSLGVPALLAERIVVGQYLDRKPPLDIDNLVAHWALAAQETARGYRSSRAQFQGDQLLRDALALIIGDLPPHLHSLLLDTLQPWDELFFAHTVPVGDCVTESAAAPGPWWGRVPQDAPGFTDPGHD